MTPPEKLLAELIAFQTTPGNSKEQLAIHTFIMQQLDGLPLYFRTLHDGDDIISVITTTDTTRPKILFVCHVDVVAGPAQLFTLQVSSARLSGRGAWDMKYAIAGLVCLMQQLGDGLRDYDFGLALTSDEETSNHNISALLESGIAPQCVVILDGGENWQLESGSKGSWNVKLYANGVTAHGSRPWEGDSATDKLLDALVIIRQHFQKQGPTTPTLNISMLEGGVAQNQIPGHASAVLDIRFVTEDEVKEIKELVQSVAELYKLRIKTQNEIAPVAHDLFNPYLRLFQQVTAETTKHESEPVLSYGTSDASVCVGRGIPAIVARPLGGGHHSDDEWIDRASFSKFEEIILRFLTYSSTV